MTKLIVWVMVIVLSTEGSVYAFGSHPTTTQEIIVEECAEEEEKEGAEETVEEENTEEITEVHTEECSVEEESLLEEDNSLESDEVPESETEALSSESWESEECETTGQEVTGEIVLEAEERQEEIDPKKESIISLQTLLLNQPIRLGNRVGNVLYSKGKFVEIDDILYFSNETGIYQSTMNGKTKICSDEAENLNYINGSLYYTVKKTDGYRLVCFNLEKEKSTVIGTLNGYEPCQMYFINDNMLLFLSGNAIYAWDIATENIFPVFFKEGILGYIPTIVGCVYAVGEYEHYTVYLDDIKIVDGCSYYSIYQSENGEEYLYYSIDGKSYYIKLKDILSGDSAKNTNDITINKNCNNGDIVVYDGEVFDSNDMGLSVDLNQLLESCETSHQHEGECCGAVLSVEESHNAYQNEIFANGELSEGQKNIVKRARQMTEIEWTPLADVKGFKEKEKNKYVKGQKYVGLPYGQCVDKGRYINYGCTLDDFAVAVNDINSLFYTTHGTFGDIISPYYSIDCSAFVAYAWGIEKKQTTHTLPNIGKEIIDIESVEIGDALIKEGSHTILIGGVTRENGGIAGIIAYHSTEPVAKIERWTFEEYKRMVQDNSYKLYRNDSRDNVTYEHSCVIPIDGDSCINCEPISISKTETSIYVGDTQQLTVTGVAPQDVYWKSENKNIVKVSSTGLIKGIKKGTVNIVAKVNGQKLICRVTVSNKTLKINPSKITLYRGQQQSIEATTVPEAEVIWKTASGKIAKVQNGVVTAISKGTTTITAKANGKTKKCTVTVKNPLLSVSKSSISIVKGTSERITATATPYAKVFFSSGNEKIATIDDSGLIIAREVGETIIKITANGITKKCTVKVKKPTLTISNNKLNIFKGYTGVIKASPLPSTTVTWKSSNEKIAVVSSAGVVKGIKCGTAIISATAHGVTKKCKVTVKKPTITLSQTQANICRGEQYTLEATSKPKTVVKWTSSDEKIVKVASTGIVKGVSVGTAYITAEAHGLTKKCKVTVKKPTIKLSKASVSLYSGEKVTLIATTRPVSTATWKSGNDKVAKVSSRGIVQGVAPGTTYILAEANGVSTKCTVTVKKPIITVSPTTLEVYAGYSEVIKAIPKPAASVTWASSDSSIAVVLNGEITGKKAGKVSIIASANGVSSKCSVTVKTPSLKIDKSSIELYKGKTGQVKAVALPSKSVVWKSNNEKIVKVSGGVISAIDVGTAYITATAHGITRYCKVTVKAPTLTVDKTSMKMKVGTTKEIDAVATPNTSITWVTSNSAFATVSKGRVTAKKKGTVIIYAKANGLTKACRVTVY